MTEQLSVFLENREGRVDEVLKLFKENNINIYSASLADTSDFGLLRMIVENPSYAREVLVKNGIMAKTTPVILVAVSNEVGGLYEAMKTIADAGISVSYMYGLSTNGAGAAIALKTDDLTKTEEVLKGANVTFYTVEDLKAMAR